MEIIIFHQVEKVLKKETKEVKEDIKDILEKLELGLMPGYPHIKSLASIHSHLFEIRVKDRNGQFRVIYFLKDKDLIYLIHAFRKKTQELPKKERDTILTRIKEIKL